MPQGSVLGPLLFAVYTSPVGDIIEKHGADDTQLHIALRTCDIDPVLSILAACMLAVKQWYLLNGLQLNSDKSEAMIAGTSYQLQAVATLKHVPVAGADLPITDELKTLGVILDRRLRSIVMSRRSYDRAIIMRKPFDTFVIYSLRHWLNN